MSAKNEEIKKSVKEVLGRFQKTFWVNDIFAFVSENSDGPKSQDLLTLKDELYDVMKGRAIDFKIQMSPMLTSTGLCGERNITLAVAVFWITQCQ